MNAGGENLSALAAAQRGLPWRQCSQTHIL
jgi:hypothetical protein